jgi:hypothetical protein
MYAEKILLNLRVSPGQYEVECLIVYDSPEVQHPHNSRYYRACILVQYPSTRARPLIRRLSSALS